MSTVLHVDRSALFRTLLKETFNGFGWKYLAAEGIEDSLQIIRQTPVDLIVTALELSDGRADELVGKVNDGKRREIPIVIMSSTDSIEIRKHLLLQGVIDFIPKTITPEQLRTYIQKLIRRDEIVDAMKEISIAVLDDSEFDLKYMKSIFDFHGITNVDFYKDPQELLKSEKKYDVYLIDVVLPKFSGDQVIYQLRSQHKSCVILAVSAVDHFKTISNVLLSGADDYILKPYNESVFIARLKSSVRHLLLYRELEKKNEELTKMIITDQLTGLYNHQYIYEQVKNEIKKSERYGRTFSVIMFDIDDFKKVNDTYGHQVGDVVLVKIAEKLRESIREVDLVARYGGEEFLVVLPETTLENAYLIAERIRQAVENLTFGEGIHVTISGGVAQYAENDTENSLVARADRLLYVAKREGKNKIKK
ncbi:MAG: diguanylate cyclase [Spirochaetes bacterium]|nr:diguanylate cyclase [Spirochaetota bacterium]